MDEQNTQPNPTPLEPQSPLSTPASPASPNRGEPAGGPSVDRGEQSLTPRARWLIIAVLLLTALGLGVWAWSGLRNTFTQTNTPPPINIEPPATSTTTPINGSEIDTAIELTFEMLKNTSYSIVSPSTIISPDGKEVGDVEEILTLVNGSYTDIKVDWPYNGLYDLFASGDMNSDGQNEAAVVLRRSTGASARAEIIFLFEMGDDGKPRQLTSNGIRVLPTTKYPHTESIEIKNGVLTVNARSENSRDATEAYTNYQIKYRLVDGILKEDTNENI